jgi:TonB family protein
MGIRKTTGSDTKRLASAWLLSLLIHGGIAALLAVMTIAVDLGVPAGAVTDLSAVSLSWTPPEIDEPSRSSAEVLSTQLPENEDWQSVLKPETQPPEKPATEFSDEATVFNVSAEAARPVVSNDAASIVLLARFESRPKPVLSNPLPPAVANATVQAAPGGGGGGNGALGVGGSTGTGGGSGGGNGTGFGTGNGSGAGSGSGTGIGPGNGTGNPIVSRVAAPAGAGARPPRAKQMDRGNYPSEARRRGQEGTVTLRVEVLTSGKVGTVEISASSGFSALDQAARDAAQRWKFYPAEADGLAITSQVLVPYTFRLVDAR